MDVAVAVSCEPCAVGGVTALVRRPLDFGDPPSNLLPHRRLEPIRRRRAVFEATSDVQQAAPHQPAEVVAHPGQVGVGGVQAPDQRGGFGEERELEQAERPQPRLQFGRQAVVAAGERGGECAMMARQSQPLGGSQLVLPILQEPVGGHVAGVPFARQQGHCQRMAFGGRGNGSG